MQHRGFKPPRTSWLRFFGLAVAGLLLLSGCMKVGPDYKPPKKQVPPTWQQAGDPSLPRIQANLVNWWEVFDDPQLSGLIKRADLGNLDLKAAVSRVKQARAQLGVVTGELYPQLDANADGTRQQASKNSLSNPTGLGITGEEFQLGASASWEIDLFGRIRRSVEAAQADLQASKEDRTDVMVSLYSQVAQTYLTARTLQARISATQENIESQKGVLKLTQARFKWGLATDLDVSQAETVLGSSQAELPPLRTSLVEAFNTLALLLGLPPSSLKKELDKPMPIPVPPEKVAVGVPADLLRQRPDIRRAERQLAAATARIGVATADLYPRFTLLGSLGTVATNASDLFGAGSLAYSIGPSISWNIFAGGSIRSQIKVQDALTEQALLTYESTLLAALKEVEDALEAFKQEKRRQVALAQTVASSRRALELAVRLYKEGLQDFQPVLDAQRNLFNYDNQLASSRGQVAIDLVVIYQALGGGWDPQDNDATGQGSAQTASAKQ
ncbi:MAG: efflux transporter outer membrane subunit [Desulfarculaceae bacterium]|nr:efflux transporter outer membrane subunit [Desulfarculaceae bacterium]MCF8072127.1 efflux transporter outer membrane subunit [Desulfarculaceae bacterium]MCF8100048.1 efflux transporter outer membrane subunit [Desulfarculaceae bacterium]MCF8118151.1 efflux transporter outer membrane subunit [Desulfarculaceae bacterium]